MQYRLTKYLLLSLLVLSARTVCAQESIHAAIDAALKAKDYPKAKQLIDERVVFFRKSQRPDSLAAYVYQQGELLLATGNAAKAIAGTKQMLSVIQSMHPSPKVLIDVYMEAGNFYESINQNDQAYKINYEAFLLCSKVEEPGKTAAIIESNLGSYANRIGDVKLSEIHHRNAIAVFLKLKKPDYNRLYTACNNMGSVMWFASKNDSALYYFNLALGTLAKMDSTPENRFWRPAVLQNNLSAIHGSYGKTTEAVNDMKSCIRNITLYLATKPANVKREKAIHFQFEATDNLAGIYKGSGDFKQALELLLYSYQQKKKNLIDEDPDIFKSQVLLGQIYFAMKENEKAKAMLKDALERMLKADGDFLFWQADAYNTLALMYDYEGAEKRAEGYYEKADALYEQSLQGQYDNIYLEFLRNAALFYAENKMTAKAILKAGKGYDYILKTEGGKSLPLFYETLNMGEVQYHAGNYKQSLLRGQEAISLMNNIVRGSTNLLDSVNIELKKPKAILLICKSEYALLPVKDVAGLKKILGSLNEALNSLEKRKQLMLEEGDISLLMSDHSELLGFVKKITLDLYNLTKDPLYAEQLISLHESGLYNRIRSRLDKSGDLRFADLPETIQQQERSTREAINLALAGDGDHRKKMQSYLEAVDRRDQFLEKLRREHKRYYSMRYGTIFRSPSDIRSRIGNDVTVIRYFFVDSVLMASVYEKSATSIINLGKVDLVKQVTAVADPGAEPALLGANLNALYKLVWAPLAGSIHHKKITIIPDGVLFNLNFEILTNKPVRAFSDLANDALIAKYSITYQYSLFLTGQAPPAKKNLQNFIAFAPGFSDEVKMEYRKALRDSNDLDKAYLSLLPQPFTTSLASHVHGIFGGDAYLNNQSTLAAFKEKAGSNRIIHIGTHAEADNLNPEFSRLIFAKGAGREEANSLYLFDIYNCNLSSDLTVLTACESGKPGYEDGEGMISLAHAFNYAGSESIITGLWKIDEQASAVIMDHFYTNILDGLSKDEALRQAKLSYLKQARGRSASPQYWAGLVLMGNTDPVAIRKNYWWVWLLGGAGLVAGAIWFRRCRAHFRPGSHGAGVSPADA